MFRHFRYAPSLDYAGVSQVDIPPIAYLFMHKRRGKCGSRDEFFSRGWGEESRTRRGDIKYILLELLSEHPSHGYDLIKEMESRYGGFRKLSPGSVYPTLQLLEEGGYLTSTTEGGKRIYTITEEGRQLLSERGGRSTANSFSAPEELQQLRSVTTELTSLLMQVARRGEMEEIKRLRELLEEVKRKIYLMLAER